MYTNNEPMVRFSKREMRRSLLKLLTTWIADQAMNRFQRVPLKMNTNARNRKASVLFPVVEQSG
jgi:hypothetical protein